MLSSKRVFAGVGVGGAVGVVEKGVWALDGGGIALAAGHGEECKWEELELELELELEQEG